MGLLAGWVYHFGRAFGLFILCVLVGCTSMPKRAVAPLPFETRVQAIYPLGELIGGEAGDYVSPLPWLSLASSDGPPISLYQLNIGYRPLNQLSVPEACQPRFAGDRVTARYQLKDIELDEASRRHIKPTVAVQSGKIIGFIDRVAGQGKAIDDLLEKGGSVTVSEFDRPEITQHMSIEKVCRWSRVDKPKPAAQEAFDNTLALALFSPFAMLSWSYFGAYNATHAKGVGRIPRDAAWEEVAPKFYIGQSLKGPLEALLADYPNRWRFIEAVDGGLSYIVLEPGHPREGQDDRGFTRDNMVIGLKGNRVIWAGHVEEHMCHQLPETRRAEVCVAGKVKF